MSFDDRLRHLAVHGVDTTGSQEVGEEDSDSLDQKMLALARLAALVAVGGTSVSSYSDLADAAVSADASPDNCVDVLVGIVDIVGAPKVVDAAPKLALALGYDIESALEDPTF